MMEDYDLVIRGGTIVTASELLSLDLGICSGKIAALGQNLTAKKVIDAGGLLVLPGAVDPHVHLEMPAGGTVSSDDWISGTIAALFGGTTTIIDFIEPETNQPLMQAYANRRALAEGRSMIDFGLHMTIARSDEETLSEIPTVRSAGMPSFKIYTTYEGACLSDEQILQVMSAVHHVGGIVLVHCENDAIIKYQTDLQLKAGNLSPAAHPRSRPAISEGEAVQRVLALAEASHTPVYIVHISTALGAEALAHARRNRQVAFGETCPQYLLLSEQLYDQQGFEGAKYVCQPPLRTPADQEVIWRLMSEGELQTIGTDHCPFYFRGQKELGRACFTDIPGGLPGIETRLALIYTAGVASGKISLNHWVDLCCTAPARIFGLYPRKGTLMPGADADLVLFDPHKKMTITRDQLHENVDYTPYENFPLQGYPIMTLTKGIVMVNDGRFSGPEGKGQYLERGDPLLF